MKTIELDLEYIKNLTSLVSKVGWCSSTLCMNFPVVAGGAVRDMLFNKPVSDIDVFYTQELDDIKLKNYFTEAKPTENVYPAGWSLTHTLKHKDFPVPIQLIKVKNITEHLATFPSAMLRVYVDTHGLHGLTFEIMADAITQEFFWDQKVDLNYYLKIKEKYFDWKHMFLEEEYNPEFEPELEF